MDASPTNPTFFEDIKRYVGFSQNDSEILRSLEPIVAPHYVPITEHFYECILGHPKAHAAITGGPAQVERLRHTLQQWLCSGLLGPHDEAFYERRARIGRMHVTINLPQQYMVTAMAVMRLDVRNVIEPELKHDLPRLLEAFRSLDRLFDLELAIMLQTYQEDTQERLRRRERLATIGQLAASIGHDLRNPLGVIESSLFILRRRATGDQRATKHLDKIANQVAQCDRIVTDLLGMARNDPPKYQPLDLADVVAEALAQGIRPERVQVQTDIEAGLTLEADPGLLQQALVNLIINAVCAIDEGEGTIRITAHAEGENVCIGVFDDGPGFDPDVLPTAFEPLVSTRANGIGLGLALVKSVLERHGGVVSAGNRDGGGAMVQLLLPKTSTAPRIHA